MKATVYDGTGKKKGDQELPASVFSDKWSDGVIHEVIIAELQNRRQGTHKVKGMSEISGGGKKPWRQKGTGHARQGSTRRPQFRGGATIFGPTPRDYTISLSPSKRRAGFRSILSQKAAAGALSVLNGFEVTEFSTAKVAGVFDATGQNAPEAKIVYVAASTDEKTVKSFANIPNLSLVNVQRLTAPELFYSDHVFVAAGAMEALEAACKKREKRKAAV